MCQCLRVDAEAATNEAASAADHAAGTAAKAVDVAVADISSSQSELEAISVSVARAIRQRQAELKQSTAAIASLGQAISVSTNLL